MNRDKKSRRSIAKGSASRFTRELRFETLETRTLLSASPVGGEFQVNTYTGGLQRHEKIATDAAGDFVVVWPSSNQDGNGYGVYAQLYNSAGAPQGSSFQVNTYTTGAQQQPAVAMDAAGDFVIVWQSNGQDGAGGGIFGQLFSNAGTPVGSEFQVNAYTTGNQGQPAVAMDADGDFAVVWQSAGAEDGSGYGVYAQLYSRGGAPQGSQFQVNTYTTRNQESPSVAMDAGGDFVIAWNSGPGGMGTGEDGSGYGVYAQRYNSAGAAEGSEFQVNTYTTGDQESPSVAMDAAGDFVIAWASYQEDGFAVAVYAQRYNSAGVAQGSEFLASPDTQFGPKSPSVSMDEAGDFAIAWEDLNEDGAGYGVYAQLYNRAGATQGTYFQVNTYTTSNQEGGQVAMDADGDFVVAWYSAEYGTYGIYAQRFQQVQTSFSGSTVGSEFHVNTNTAFADKSPKVATDADGDYVIVWDSSGEDGSDDGIYAQRYNSAGVTQGSEFRVNTYTTNYQSAPVVAMDARGDFVVAWNSVGQDGSPNKYGVYAQLYNSAGMPVGSEFLVNSTYTTGANGIPAVAMDAAGDFVIAWGNSGEDGYGYGIYAQMYNSAGAPQGSAFLVNTYTSGTQKFPSVAMDEAGDFVIAWNSGSAGMSGSHQDGSQYGVYAQRYNKAGVPQGSEFRVNTYTTGSQYGPSAAMDAAGDFVVVWNSTQEDGYSIAAYAQLFNAMGVAQGSEFLVSPDTQYSPVNPKASMDAAGTFVITWNAYQEDGALYGVYAQIYNSAGATEGSFFQVNTYTTSTQNQSAVALDAAGDFIDTWYSYQNNPNYGIYAQRYQLTATETVAKLVVSATPTSLSAGQTTSVTITAEDSSNNVDTAFADTVTLSDSLSGASFGTVSFSGGVATVTATLDTAGTQTITATDPTATIAGSSSPITVAPAAATTVLVSASPGGLSAGSTSSVTITTEDQYNNVVTGFSDSVTLSDSLGGASFSAVSFTNGLATVSATLDAAGTQTITASDSSATIIGTSSPITVTPAAASKLVVSASSGASGTLNTSATYSAGVSEPYALAFDSSGNLYVANFGNNTVEKFAPGMVTPSATYTIGVSFPYALAIDSSGNLYVANDGNSTVEKFAPGSTTASATYTAGVSGPDALAIDVSGNLYVANSHNHSVEKFAPGSTTPSATYPTGNSPEALAFDSSGNLYVANYDSNNVEEFAPGSTTPIAIDFAGVENPDALAIDVSGNLYVANYFGNTVEKFAPGSTTPSATYSAGVTEPDALAFDSSGNLYVANTHNNTVEVFAPGSTTASATYSPGLNYPTRLAFDSSGNLFVASEVNNRVIELSPPVTGTTAGGTVSVAITAEDQYNNVVTGFNDSVTLTDSLGGASFSANPVVSFTSGVATVTATLDTAGTQTITASDQAATVSGTSNSINVTPATASKLLVSASPSSLSAGQTTSVTITVQDQYGNGVTGDTIRLSDSSGGESYTARTFSSAGVATFTATLDTAGTQTITASDQAATISATSGPVTVTPAAASKLVISASPSSLTAGNTTRVSITAEDRYSNVVTGFGDTVTLADSLGGASFSPISFTGGAATVTATLDTAGTQTITATDSSATIAGTSNSITVNSATPPSFDLTISTSPTNNVSFSGGVFSATGGNPNISITDLQAALVNDANVSISNAGLTGDTDNIEWLAGANLNSSGIPSGHTLTIETAPSATSGNLSIASTVNLPGDILLSGKNVALNGSINTSGTLWINSGGGVSQSAPLSAANLSVAASGNVALSASNTVSGQLAIHDAALGAFIEWLDADGFEVGAIAAATAAEDPQSIFGAVSGVSASGNFIALENTSGNMLLGNGQAGEGVTASGTGGDVRLESAGAITQNAAGGAITAGALGIVAGGNVDLSQTPNTATLVAIDNSSGYVRFVDSSGFTVGTMGGVSSAIFPNAVHGVTTVGGDIGLQNNAGSMLLGNGNTSDVVSATGAGGDVRLDSAGGIMQNPGGGGAVTAGGFGIVANGNVDLSQTPNTLVLTSINDSSGYVRFVDTESFIVGSVGGISANLFPNAVHGVTTVGGDVALQSNTGSMQLGNGNASEVVSATGTNGNVRLDSAVSIYQSSTGGGAITAAALGIVAGGNVELSQTPNTLVLTSINDSSGYVRFVDTESFIVGSVGGISANLFPNAVHGVTTVGGDIALQSNTGSMQLGNGNASEVVSATGANGDVRLEAAYSIYQFSTGGGAITAGALGIVAGGNVELSQTPNTLVLTSINDSSGYVRFVDTESFIVGSVGGISANLFPNAVHGVTTVGGDIALQSNTGSMQLGNGNASEVVSATGAGGDVRLEAAYSIYQFSTGGGAITAGALGIVAGGNVELSQTPNTLVLTSISDSSGYVRFVDTESFIVGSVGGISANLFPNAVHGVTTVNGDIALQSNTGSMQLGNGNASEVVSATGAAGDVRLEAAGGITQGSGGSGAVTAGALGIVAAGTIQLGLTMNDVSAVLAIDDTAAGTVNFRDSSTFAEGTVGAISPKIFPHAISGVTTVTPNPTL